MELTFHPNGMKFTAFDKEGEELKEFKVYSIGGGTVSYTHLAIHEVLTSS